MFTNSKKLKSVANTRKVVWAKLASQKGNDYIWPEPDQLNETPFNLHLSVSSNI